MSCYGEPVEWLLLYRMRPVRLVWCEPCGGLAIQLHHIERLVVAGGVELVDGLLESVRINAQLGGKLADRVCLNRLLVCRVVDPK